MIRPLLAVALAAVALTAQIPHGHLVFANRVGTTTIAGLQLLDPFTGVVTPLYQPGASLSLGGGRTVAYDPAAPNTLYTSTTLSISVAATVTQLQLTGNEYTRSTVTVNLGSPGVPFHLRYAPGFGLLLIGRGGQLNRMYLRDLSAIVHTQPTANLLPNNASDLAFLNGVAYASSEGDGTTVLTGTIVAWDLAANTDRVLGSNYPPIHSLAVFAGQLIAGDDVGNVFMVDTNTGGLTPFLVTGLGRINSLAVDPLGIVYMLVTNGSTCSIYSMIDLVTPLYTTTSSIVEDLEAGISPVPTMLSFGSGCMGSNQQTPVFVLGSMPALGSTFTVQARNALANSASLLVIGNSRLGDGFGPLPRPLDGIGMINCTQYTGVLVSAFAATSSTGDASVSFNLPNSPGLAGLKLPMQWVIADPLANTLGATASNGAEVFLR